MKKKEIVEIKESPHQECPDVIVQLEGLEKSFGNLKLSKRSLWSLLPNAINDASQTALSILQELNTEFTTDVLLVLRQACLDESVVCRTEVKIDAKSNRVGAWIGDAFIRLYIAKKLFRLSDTPEPHIFQKEIEQKASTRGLASFYNHLFGEKRVIVNFSGDSDWHTSSIQENQKGTYIESLIGLLYEHGHNSLAHWLASMLYNFHSSQKK